MQGELTSGNSEPGLGEILNLRDEHCRLLFDANPSPMWICDEETLAFLAVNEAAVRQYGYSRDEYAKMTLKDIRPVADVPMLLKAVKEQRGRLVEKGGLWRHRKKDGSMIYADVTLSSVNFDGRAARLLLAHDVTEHLRVEGALLQSQRRLASLLASTPAVIYSCSPTPPYAATYMADSIRSVLGYEPQEFLTDANFWATNIHPEDAPRVFADLQNLFHAGRCVYEYRFKHHDGTYRWMRDELCVLRNADGVAIELFGCWIDITDRKRIETDLRRTADLLELTHDSILVRGLDDRIIYWNHGSEELYGWTAAEAIGQVTHELLKTQFPQPLEKIKSQVLSLGRWEGELVQSSRDGRILAVASRWSAELDREGRLQAILQISNDITEQKQAQQALRFAHEKLEERVCERTRELAAANRNLLESQERFQQMADNIQEVFWLASPGLSRIIYVSPAYEFVWGRTRRSLYEHPHSWFDAIHPDDQSLLRSVFTEDFGKQKFEYEYRVVRPDGSIRRVLDRGFPVFDSAGRLQRIAGIATDVTERRELEDEILAAAEREKQRIGQDLHDDLCQQLAGIEFLSKALQQQLKGAAAERAGEVARLVRDAAEHTRRLARGLIPLHLESDGLMHALEALAARIQGLFHIECSFHCAPAVLIDNASIALHLYRIAQEAVTNAIRHGKAGQIEIKLARVSNKAILAVDDNGNGKGAKPGNVRGLGLRIMNYRANSIGGTFIVEKRPNGGTTVVCTVPLLPEGAASKVS